MKLYAASVFLLLASSVAISSATDQGDPAVVRFEKLQAKLKASHDAKDWESYLTGAVALKDFLNGTATAHLEVARAEMRLGQLAAASHEVEQFVGMGQSSDFVSNSPEFADLRRTSGFEAIRTRMEANRRPVSLASVAFRFQDSDLLPEDVDYDSGSRRFLVTSVHEHKIVAINAEGVASDFAKSPDDWPMMALKVDEHRRLVWVTEVAVKGYSSVPAADWGRSAILCYDLRSRKLLRRVEGPAKSALGDMTISANGDVVVSDGDGGGLYRMRAKGARLERLDNGDFISPQTPAMHPDGKHIFVPDYVRGLAVLDVATREVRWLSSSGRFALNGMDGLYFDRGRLIAVQNGTSPERVVVFNLDATLSSITSENIVERSTPTLGDPTHGVFVGKDFYYIANSGWDRVDDHGNFQSGVKAAAPLIMRVDLSTASGS